MSQSFVCLQNVIFFVLLFSSGSLGARINELKQKVIAENPHRYGVAVPREFTFFISYTLETEEVLPGT